MTRFSTINVQRQVLAMALLAVALTGILISIAGIWPLRQALNHAAENSLLQVHAVHRVGAHQFFHTLSDVSQQIASRTAIRKALYNMEKGFISREELISFSEGKLLDSVYSTPSLHMIARYDARGDLLLRAGAALDDRDQIPFPTLIPPGPIHLWFGAPIQINGTYYLFVANALHAPFAPSTGSSIEGENPAAQADSLNEGPIIGYDLLAFSLEGLAEVMSRSDGVQSPYHVIIGTVQKAVVSARKDNAVPPQLTWYTVGPGTSGKPTLQPLSSHGIIKEQTMGVIDDPLLAPLTYGVATTTGQAGEWSYVQGMIDQSIGGTTSGTLWVLRILSPTTEMTSSIQNVLISTILIMLVLMIMVGAALWLILRPLQDRLVVQTQDLELQVKQLKSLGEELALERERLRQSNEELEQFAYAASHDLQQPLRMVSGFLEVLRRQYGDKLDENAHEFIGFAVDGAHRMRAMITDLLEYSRVGRLESALCPVSLEEVVRITKDILALPIAESRAEITVSSLPTVTAIEAQMIRLFQNLIDNAIKYRHPNRLPRIAIHARQEDEHWIICVRDNGIGVDPRSQERAFQLFQRFHPQLECTGTGMGLAMCAKIVKRHGGRIWLESVEDEGTSVCFTMPVHPPPVPSPESDRADSKRTETSATTYLPQ